jgi:tRNA U34 5-methylaminomethyl-2-thiouridine-forming methyltransferase MnmC
MKRMAEIIVTEDGSHTLFVPELNEHYHSVHGAIQESDFIFIKSGLDYCKTNPARIFEVGFGTGLNTFLTCVNATAQNRKIEYTSIENNPLPGYLIDSLNYKNMVGSEYSKVFEQLHSCNWNVPERINKNFTLLKIKADLTDYEVQGNFDLIYFDAFGPDKQPEMWSDAIFEKVSGITDRNGILVTYSAKGSVQRALKKNGFEVDLLPGPPGKRQIIRAIKI